MTTGKHNDHATVHDSCETRIDEYTEYIRLRKPILSKMYAGNFVDSTIYAIYHPFALGHK